MKERRKGRKVAAGEEGDGLKKGPWTAAEDAVLAEYVREHGEGNWNAVQRNSGLSRCGKSCRLRWANHLRPNLKKGAFSPDEELLILRLHAQLGNKWARMASHLPGRTDNEIKNYWNTRIKRRLRAGLPLYPPEIQSLAANQLSPTSPNPPPSPAAPTFTLSFLDPSTLPPVPAPVPPLVTHVPFLNPAPQLPPIRRYRSADGLIFQATLTPPPPPISPLYHQPLGFDPGSFEVGAGGPISHPTSLSVKTELPSNQLFPDAVCPAGDSGGESLGRTNSGLLDALLEEAQGLGDRQRGELIAEVPAGRENLLFFWADDENGEICTAGAGETKTRRVLANEINLVQEDISTLLDMIPSAPLPLSPVVPDWYNDDNGEMSNGHSSVVTEDDIGLDIQQLASSIPVSPQDQVWSIGSCTWNNMPGIC